jgi:GDSL-like Lipase/Acylhydrolase
MNASDSRSIRATLLAAVAALAMSACGGSGGTAAQASGLTPSAAAGTGTSASTPVGVVAIGHSGLTGQNSDPARPDQDVDSNSWATGTSPEVNSVYRRLAAARPQTEGHVANAAVDGARVEALASQAASALGAVTHPALVIVQTIDNDIRCDGTDNSHVPQFGVALREALLAIQKASPGSRILMVGQLGRPSIAFVKQLVAKAPDVKSQLTGTGPCDFFTPDGRLAPKNFATLTAIIDSYEAEQARQCASVPLCAVDGGVRAAYKDKLENFSSDWNHLNVKGQAAAAQLIWPKVSALLSLG